MSRLVPSGSGRGYNGCSYQEPVLVAILKYFMLFLDQTYHFEERHFSRWHSILIGYWSDTSIMDSL